MRTQDLLVWNGELIQNFRIILDTINCNQDIDAEKFDEHCKKTAELYVSLYSWHPMVNTVHKILAHGARMISEVSLPIGMYSEEAQETGNKVFRYSRLHHSRKCNRTATNEDVFKYMLAISDPYVSRFMKTPVPHCSPLHPDVQALLKDTDLTPQVISEKNQSFVSDLQVLRTHYL